MSHNVNHIHKQLEVKGNFNPHFKFQVLQVVSQENGIVYKNVLAVVSHITLFLLC